MSLASMQPRIWTITLDFSVYLVGVITEGDGCSIQLKVLVDLLAVIIADAGGNFYWLKRIKLV